MLKSILIPVFFVFSLISVCAQHGVKKCATAEMEAHRKSKSSDYESREDFERWIAPKVMAYKKGGSKIDKSGVVTYTIPVVIHIIHNSNEAIGTGRNISNAQAVSQIDVLNEDFTRTNADASNTPVVFAAVAANCEINFCLATEDPDGNEMSEVGIHRVSTSTLSGVDNTFIGYSFETIDGVIKGATQWDPERYLNIWVCQIADDILGYAIPPVSSGLPGVPKSTDLADVDGVVLNYDAFGRVGNLHSSYNMGRTCTHEVGHWLGLLHVWGNDFCGTDYCGDTPEQETSNTSCTSHPSPSCGNSGDMFMNYMDYPQDACLNLFTQDQKARMVTVLQNPPRRKSLLTSTVCGGDDPETGCDTLSNIGPEDTPVLIHNPQGDWGWVAGHNDFNDIGKAEYFVTASEKDVLGVKMYFVKAHAGQPSSTIDVKVWESDAGEPGNVMATETLNVDDLDIYPTPTYVTFANPPTVSGEFFVGIQFSPNDDRQDSIALMSNKDKETDPGTAWELWGDNTWAEISNVDGWDLDISMAIYPMVCDKGVGIEENLLVEDRISIYPNPSEGIITLELREMIGEEISVYNLFGERVYQNNLPLRDEKITINLEGYSSGVYFVSLKTERGMVVRKINVIN